MTEMLGETMRITLRSIRLLAMDSDGVLTDGGVYINEDGHEFRRFDIKDGLGLRCLIDSGIAAAVISASSVKAVQNRCAQLGIKEVHLAVGNKLECLETLCTRLEIPLSQVAYIGDDLTDLPVLEVVGLPCAPADAVKIVRHAAQLVMTHPGGRGAVRELCDLIIEAHENKL